MSKYLLALFAACALVSLTAALYIPPICSPEQKLENCKPAVCIITCKDFTAGLTCPFPPSKCYDPVCVCKGENKFINAAGKCVDGGVCYHGGN